MYIESDHLVPWFTHEVVLFPDLQFAGMGLHGYGNEARYLGLILYLDIMLSNYFCRGEQSLAAETPNTTGLLCGVPQGTVEV